MTEAKYQSSLIKKLKQMFPGCTVIKNDPSQQQGILDLTILYGPFWGMLEVKASGTAPYRPNQEYYIEHYDNQGFAARIFPENERQVLFALQEAFASRGATRLPES